MHAPQRVGSSWQERQLVLELELLLLEFELLELDVLLLLLLEFELSELDVLLLLELLLLLEFGLLELELVTTQSQLLQVSPGSKHSPRKVQFAVPSPVHPPTLLLVLLVEFVLDVLLVEVVTEEDPNCAVRERGSKLTPARRRTIRRTNPWILPKIPALDSALLLTMPSPLRVDARRMSFAK